jgi:hypothetical protein
VPHASVANDPYATSTAVTHNTALCLGSRPDLKGKLMKRREFIALLAGLAAARPFVAHSQPADRIRLVGVLMATGENDPVSQARLTVADGARHAGFAASAGVRMIVPRSIGVRLANPTRVLAGRADHWCQRAIRRF